MALDCLRIKIPRVVHVCCGYKYDSKNIKSLNYFRCFKHKSLKEKVYDINGNLRKVDYCLTLWLVCKNNDCITSFTYFYDCKNHVITHQQTSGLKYILSIKDKFIENIPLRVKTIKEKPNSNKYLWRYTDQHPTKKFVSNIYTLDDKKIGETEPQQVKVLRC